MNRRWIAVVVVVVLVGAGVYYFRANLNSLIAGVIETNGSRVTETDVRVSGVSVVLRDGRGSIDNLTIASPKGYQANDVFTLGNITMDIDARSGIGNPVVIDEIRISEPVVFAEFTKTGSSNIDELRKRVQDYAATRATGSGKAGAKRVRIALFVLEKGRIDVDASALGVEKRTIDLPEIRLTDVGGGDGALPDEIAKEILTAVARAATNQVATSEIHKLIDKQLAGESLGDKAMNVIDKIIP